MLRGHGFRVYGSRIALEEPSAAIDPVMLRVVTAL